MRFDRPTSPAAIRHALSLGVLILAFLGGFFDGLRRGVEDAGRYERLVLPGIVCPMELSR